MGTDSCWLTLARCFFRSYQIFLRDTLWLNWKGSRKVCTTRAHIECAKRQSQFTIPETASSDPARARHNGVKIHISEQDYRLLRNHLLGSGRLEQHAFLFAGLSMTSRGTHLLVRNMVFANDRDFIQRSSTYLHLQPSYFLPVLDRCRKEGLHPIEVHSHPFADKGVTYSALDLDNERNKMLWYAERMPDTLAATMVFGHGSFDGHWYDSRARKIRALDNLRVVGKTIRDLRPTSSPELVDGTDPYNEVFNRQELAYGAAGQALLRNVRVGLVGLGGLGGVLACELAYLGVRDFVLVDMDRVEETNLNRLMFAFPADAERQAAKVEVAQRGIQSVRPDAHVEAICASVDDPNAKALLRDVDVIIAGTDSQAARLTVNRLAVQYLIPYIDLGTGITVRDGQVMESGGQIKLVHPGGYCLQCIGNIDPDRARIDTMNDVEKGRRIARGYGVESPQPSVIFLNAALASLAVGEFVKMVTGYREPESMVYLDALKPSVQAITPPSKSETCPVCHRQAAYARGDEVISIGYLKECPSALPLSEEPSLVSSE